ncbi:GGDEF domain-containing protein [Rhodanobacter koreensis]
MSVTHITSGEALPSGHHAPADSSPTVEKGGRRTSAHSAFWIMTRRVTVLAACVDMAFLVFFLAVGSPLLAWLNLISISMYGAAYVLLTRRRNLPAIILIWTEVTVHAVIGTLLVGWDSGFHYYLLMFIPAIVVSGGWRNVIAPLLFLFLAYLGLHVAAHFVGALAPLNGTALLLLNLFNVSIFFAMASYTARFYYDLVRKTERKLRELATKDALTGLSNRRHLLDLAQQEIARARRSIEEVSLILVDIDDFKLINDGHGHDAGDQVLVHASQLFRGICRAQDTVARWGGEEFLFLLPATGQDAVREFAERVRVTIAETRLEHAGESIRFSLSLGVATLAGSESLDDAISRADSALYRSKTEGRNRVTAALHPAYEEPASWQGDVEVSPA